MRAALAALGLVACGSHPPTPPAVVPKDGGPVIDRFSSRAAHLHQRDKRPTLPAPGAPIDFDRPPFVNQGFGPDGVPARYYDFDVQSDTPATLYRFTHAGARAAIAGQPDLVDVLPGDAGYSDFWRISWVEVPESFAPGSVTSVAQLHGTITKSDAIIDCPIVPPGSTANDAHGVAPVRPTELAYRGAKVTCLLFAGELVATADKVPTSPIYVTFASEAGPAGGFRTEGATRQTHNVLMSVPGDTDYSPLWAVHIYDRRAFELVHDASSALRAREVERGPLVNCPVISVGAR